MHSHPEEAAGEPTDAPAEAPRRALRDYAGLVLRGMAMGSADVVPGVSGGTMAFILGIYEELIDSIRMLGRPEFLRALVRLRFVEAFRLANVPFLLAVVCGDLIAIISLAHLVTWALDNQPVMIWSFFFGLVLASAFVVRNRVRRWSVPVVASLLIGGIGAWVLVGAVPAQTPEAPWFVFLSGALAICAMILPGISGAFILLLLGKYQFIINALLSADVLTVVVFALGCVVGLVTFAQVLGWLFRHYHDLTVALLIGLMLGSLRKVWPWKEVISTFTDRHGNVQPLVEHNVLPNAGGEIVIALVVAVVGVVAVILLERLGAEDERVR